MTREEIEASFDKSEYIKVVIKRNYEPVEDKPGYVWLSKRNFQIISIETLTKSLEKEFLYNKESEE